MKRNRLAVIAAAAALVATSVALLATIVFANDPHLLGEADSSHPVEPETFVVHAPTTEDRPGQSKPSAQPEGDASDDDREGGEAEELESNPDEKPTRVAEAKVPTPRKTPRANDGKRGRTYKAAVLQIVTNFDEVDVTVNDIAYPEYFEPGDPEGMVLPAGGPYDVRVTLGEKTKNYQVYLRPYETRLLLVDLTGYNSGAKPAPKRPVATKKKKEKKEKKDNNDQDKPGKITVYSKPSGVVIVDGKNTGEKTPGSVEMENGRHEVQVEYETGSVSEKKIVRVRTGSRIKLFFRERKK